MKRKFYTCFTVVMIAVVLLVHGIAQEPSSQEELWDYISGIVGKSHDGRRDYIIDRLLELRVDFKVEPFQVERTSRRTNEKQIIQGENIIALLGSGEKRIIIGGHYDAVPNSPGANDNGAAVAIILALANHLKDKNLGHRLELVFFDHEERGLIGSGQYVEKHPQDNIYAVINLDVVGVGDMLYIGPVGGGDDDVIMPYIRNAAEELNLKTAERPQYPGSDHRSFMQKNIENISISVMEEETFPLLERVMFEGDRTVKREEMSKIMTYMHTPNDNLDYISKRAMEMVFELLMNVVERIEAN